MKIKKLLASILSVTILISALPAMAEEEKHQNFEQTEQADAMRQNAEQHMNEFIEKMNSARIAESEISLMSVNDEVTLSGTITFPSPVPEDGYVFVEPHKGFEKDGNKILNSAVYSNSSGGGSGWCGRAISVKKGSTSVDYSMSVKEGIYAIRFQYNGSGNIRNSSLYYAEKGAALNLADADMVQMTEDKSIDFAFPAAERTISGTITLNKPAPEDSDIYVSCENAITWDYYDVNIPVNRGQTEVNYSIGVDKGMYTLVVCMNYEDYKYYSIMETVDADYNNCYYFNVNDKSMDNIDFTYTYNDKKPDEDNTEADEENTDTNFQPVSITLPEAVSETTTYTVCAEYEENSREAEITVNAGESTGSGKIYIPYSLKDESFVLEIFLSGNTYYYTEQGLIKDYQSAQKMYFDKNNTIHINCTDFYILKGSVSRSGAKEGDYLDTNVYAEANGYSFYTSAAIDKSSDTAPYSLYVPKHLNGDEFTVYANIGLSRLGGYIDSKGDAVSVTISESMENVNIGVKNVFERITGILSLSEPIEKGGIIVSIASKYYYESRRYMRYTVCQYCIPEGEDSIEYEVDILTGNQGADTLTFNLDSLDKRFDVSGNMTVGESETNDCTIQIAPVNDKKITGYIKIPDTLTSSNAISYQIVAEYEISDGNYDSADIYDTIPTGERSQQYSIEVPGSATLLSLYARPIASGMVPIIEDSIYYIPEENINDDAEISIPLTDGLENADITLEKGIGISGKIIVPDGVDIKYDNCYVIAESTDRSQEKEVVISDYETPYMIVIPESSEGNIKVSCRAYISEDIYTDTVYYTGDKVAIDEKNAAELTIGEDDTSNININLADYKSSLDMDIYSPAYNMSFSVLDDSVMQIYAVLDNGARFDDIYIYIPNYDEENHTKAELRIPDVFEYKDVNSFKLYYDVDNENNNEDYLFKYEGMCVNPDGTCTMDESKMTAHEIKKNAKISFTVWDNSILIKDAVDSNTLTLDIGDIQASANKIQGNVHYTNSGDTTYMATVLIAAYDENGILTDMRNTMYILDEPEEGDISLSFSPKAAVSKYKIFLWNNTGLLTPLTAAEEVSATAGE